MTVKRDIEVAEKLGQIEQSVKNIEQTMQTIVENIQVHQDHLEELEKNQERQKAYIAAAVFIGSLIVGAVDVLYRWYTTIKGK